MLRLLRVVAAAFAVCACSNGSAVRDGGAAPDGSSPTLVPPSCAGLAPTCGANGDEDCCASPAVTGGTFERSYYDGTAYSDPIYSATVSSFRLDKFEITVRRFRKFVDAGAPAPAAGAGKHAHLNGGSGLVAADGGYEPGWDVAWILSSSFDADLTTNCIGSELSELLQSSVCEFEL
jgi:formylglycine-generating enzyme